MLVCRIGIVATIVALCVNTGWTQSLDEMHLELQEDWKLVVGERRGEQEKIRDLESHHEAVEEAWAQCSRRKGVASMNRLVKDIEDSRAEAEEKRRRIEVRRNELERKRRDLEMIRRDLSDRSLVDRYMNPFGDLIHEYRELLRGYAAYRQALRQYAGGYTGIAARCENRKSIASQLGGFATSLTKLVDAIPDLPGVNVKLGLNRSTTPVARTDGASPSSQASEFPYGASKIHPTHRHQNPWAADSSAASIVLG